MQLLHFVMFLQNFFSKEKICKLVNVNVNKFFIIFERFSYQTAENFYFMQRRTSLFCGKFFKAFTK